MSSSKKTTTADIRLCPSGGRGGRFFLSFSSPLSFFCKRGGVFSRWDEELELFLVIE